MSKQLTGPKDETSQNVQTHLNVQTGPMDDTGQNVQTYLNVQTGPTDYTGQERIKRSELRGASISHTNPMSQPLRVSFYF